MDLGIRGRSAIVVGGNHAVATACAETLSAEGATLLGPTGPFDSADIVVAAPATAPRIGISELGDEGLELTRAWHDVSALCADIQSALPNMTKRRFGRIIFIGPIAAKSLGDGDLLDRIASLGMLGLQKNLAGEFGEHGITANSVLYDGDSGPADTLLANVAAACTYLASRQAGYLTGTVMTVDASRQRSVF